LSLNININSLGINSLNPSKKEGDAWQQNQYWCSFSSVTLIFCPPPGMNHMFITIRQIYYFYQCKENIRAQMVCKPLKGKKWKTKMNNRKSPSNLISDLCNSKMTRYWVSWVSIIPYTFISISVSHHVFLSKTLDFII